MPSFFFSQPDCEDLPVPTLCQAEREHSWHGPGELDNLRFEYKKGLRRLWAERTELIQLYRRDPKVGVVGQMGVLSDLCRTGEIPAIGHSDVRLRNAGKTSLLEKIGILGTFITFVATVMRRSLAIALRE